MAKKSLFEVDVAGLRQLQEGKPKWFIIRELLQNAMDEKVTTINVTMSYSYGKADITVEDDSPEGFRNLADAYTLFGDTHKRSNPTMRGRFNMGEKQVICLTDVCRIVSTTGTVFFDVKKGVRELRKTKRPAGTEVWLQVRMWREEFEECITHLKQLKIRTARCFVKQPNDETFAIYLPFTHKTFSAELLTEHTKNGGAMRRVSRVTPVFLYKEETSYLYEMGIPVCEIECAYSIDVQQRVPLSPDRDTVPQTYLRTLYGEVLKATHEEVTPEKASDSWVREGFVSDRVDKDTIVDITTKRFGDNALIANPLDARSMDEAITNGHRLVYGSNLSGDEWKKIKQFEVLQSTSQVFKTGVANGEFVGLGDLTTGQDCVRDICADIAREILGIDLKVSFYKSPGATVMADYEPQSCHLRFNLSHIPAEWWTPGDDSLIRHQMLDLIIHELGHSGGWHYEHGYHAALTKLGAKLTLLAANNRGFFKLYK